MVSDEVMLNITSLIFVTDLSPDYLVSSRHLSNITVFYQLARQICKIEPALEKATFQYRLIETP